MTLFKSRIFTAVCGFLLMFYIGIFYAWSLFKVSLLGICPEWTASQLSMPFTVYIVAFCLGSLFGGTLGSRRGMGVSVCVGAAVLIAGGGALMLCGRLAGSAALVGLNVSYGVLCGFGAGMEYNAIISGVVARFPERAGLTSGLMLTGLGFGSLVMGILTTSLGDALGFFTVFGSLVILLGILLVPASLVLRSPSAAAEKGAGGSGATPAEMLRSPSFWLFFLSMIFLSSTGLMVLGSAATIALSFGVAATLGMIVSVFNGLSRMGIGVIFDRFGGKTSTMLACALGLLAAVLLTISALTRSVALMLLGLVLSGVTYGCCMSLNAAVIRELFGSAHYGSNFSVVTLGGIFASFIGPCVSGALQDRSGGGYTTTFIAMAVFSAVSLLLAVGMMAAERRRAD